MGMNNILTTVYVSLLFFSKCMHLRNCTSIENVGYTYRVKLLYISRMSIYDRYFSDKIVITVLNILV